MTLTPRELSARSDAANQSRRAEITSALTAETGIDEAMIETLVHRFYDKVRADALLGPVFEARIADWAPHLARMCDFWSSVALMSGRYHGTPMAKHLQLPIDAVHFDQWLALFAATAQEVCPPAAAAHFVARARRIAESLEMGVGGFNGAPLGKGGRYRIPNQA